jgi:hypothetical protein
VLLLIWLLVFGLQIAIYVFVPPVVLLVVLTFVYLLPGVAANSSGYASLILSLLNFDTSKYVWEHTAKTKCRKLEKKYSQKRSLSPNFHIRVSVSELYIPTMGLPFLLEEICGPILGIYKSLIDT